MSLKITVTCVAILLLRNFAKCANILGIFPAPSPSHFIMGDSLMRSLAEHGHNVTIISPFSNQNGTYRSVTLTGFTEKKKRKINLFEIRDVSVLLTLPFYIHAMSKITEETLEHKNVQTFLNSAQNFDIVIILQGLNDALKGFADHFNASLVVLSSLGANLWVNVLAGNPAPTAYVTHPLLPYYTELSFRERTINTFITIYDYILQHIYVFPKQKHIYDNYFPNGPPFYNILYSASMYFFNYHPFMNQPVPYLPTMVDIGGSHLEPTKKLPQTLETFLNESHKGVIYFNMGSNLKSVEMPPKIRDVFVKTFKKLNTKVLWKWEDGLLPGQTNNIRTEKWIPQQAVLAHRNVKIFISHCGLFSTIEAIEHGVPILGIPIFADQKMNAKMVKKQGFGTFMDFKEISEEVLTDNIVQLLKNPKYSTNAKIKSKIFQDNQRRPIDAYIYWIEYLIRHKNATHLLRPADFSWCQYMLMDVIGIVLVVVLISKYTFTKILKVGNNFCSILIN